ncbi:MAG: hypothetical protein RR778_06950 [Glutamicibacter sp.]|uniref:hypothetical protein n=1 Tax=Glutamicibacter sp. TaxID=1931995 RepID=UPI002FC8AAA8
MSREALVAPGAELEPEELARYSRHLSLPGVGEEGQRRIANAKVLVIGAWAVPLPATWSLRESAPSGSSTMTPSSCPICNDKPCTGNRMQGA